MTLSNLKSRLVSIRFAGYGHFAVAFKYRGSVISCRTNNTLAIDRINSDLSSRCIACFYTERQAFLSLYDECKRKNNIL